MLLSYTSRTVSNRLVLNAPGWLDGRGIAAASLIPETVGGSKTQQ